VLFTSEARRSQNLAYIYLGNTQVATRSVAWGTGAVSVRYQHTDALGSPVAETTETGAVAKRNSYEPFGAAWGQTSIDGTGYTGHVMDRDTGLTYMQQRYYDPLTGRFMGVDPEPDALNAYRYASNNPFRFSDPDGRASSDVYPNGEGSIAASSDDTSSARELRARFGKGTAGMGHHWVPFGSTTNLPLSVEARTVFGQAVSGQPIPGSLHCTGHCGYNADVRKELKSWASSQRIDLAKMTKPQAMKFVDHIRAGAGSQRIGSFVMKINNYTDAARRFGPTFARVAFALGLYQQAQQQVMSINSVPCVASPGNPCER
jgi:RHS repeat-associated protein